MASPLPEEMKALEPAPLRLRDLVGRSVLPLGALLVLVGMTLWGPWVSLLLVVVAVQVLARWLG